MPCIDREKGAAVIVALLTVALVAGIATMALSHLGAALESLSDRQNHQAAYAHALGAIDWARAALAEDARTSSVDHLRENWTIKVPATHIEDGEVRGEVQDLSGHFNLNDLIKQGNVDRVQQNRFERLAMQLGFSSNQSRSLLARLTAWMEASSGTNGSRARGRQSLSTVDELMQFGLRPDEVNRLRPHVTALPPGELVNVNTASAEVLFAITPGLQMDGARSLVASRAQAWFKDRSDFSSRATALSGVPVDLDVLTVVSRHFLARTEAQVGPARVGLDALIERDNGKTVILWKQFHD